MFSYDENTVLRSVCVFVGDFTLDAAEAVLTRLDDFPTSVLEGVSSLVDKSLLHLREEEGHEPRLYLLEVMREYGLERLAECGELDRCRDACTAYYQALSEES